MTALRAPTGLLIIGAGGLARETVAAVHAINDHKRTFRLLGYLDDDPALHGTVRAGVTILGGSSMVDDFPEVAVVVCVASPRNQMVRAHVVERLGLPLHRYATVIHPSVSVGVGCVIGPGTILLAQTVLTANVTVGAHVAVMPQTVLTHDDVIERYATIASGVRLGGSVRLGEGSYIGAGALVREGVTVGAGALVGMGSTVLRDVPAGEVWVGSPAERMRAARVPARRNSGE
jgi:sugar O-acyltransferase (sialic acid O-acetyltransferase NeuD family)